MEATKTPLNNDAGILASMSNAMDGVMPQATTATTATLGNPQFLNAPQGTGTATGTTIADNTAASVNNIKEAFANITSVNENMFYLIVIAFLVMVIVAYFLYYIITDNILYQQKIDVEGTEVPIICNELSEFKITKSLPNSNGIKRSYGFWIYINDIDKYTGEYRHIAHLGKDAGQITNACPYIFLDKTENKIHVRFAPKKDKLGEATLLTDTKETSRVPNILTYTGGTGNNCGITIKYVPIQRWVHIVIVISDVNGGLVYTYIDGELADQDNQTLILHELGFENKVDTLFVGGNISNTTIGAAGFSGLLSKFSYYNYDLNKNDIYKEYTKGPLNGLLTSMGIVSYGLRNPVYKINNVQ
jgi:hypothetical protein